jgi:dTMP kinase
VEPLLAEGTWVVLDRFVDSSLAYQGGGRKLGTDAVRAINEFATGGLAPDLTLLLRVEPATGRERLAVRGEQLDRMEMEDEEFFDRVKGFYDQLAHEPRVRVIDAGRPFEDVLRDAIAAVEAL